MPLPAVHPQAQLAGEASEAAAAQDAFWPMHDHLYAAHGRLGREDLVLHAAALGLDAERVRAELAGGVHAGRVARDDADADARAAGVKGTPAFFVNGVLHDGAFDAGSLVEALDDGARQ